MKSLDLIRDLAERAGDALVVACNGLESRELHAVRDRDANFYMIGSMGLASSIGLGLALARPERRVVVLDGDGNLLMALGAMANVGAARPENFTHVVLDNGSYASTGGQATVSGRVALDEIARACGYRWIGLGAGGLGEALRARGPAFLHVRVEPASVEGLPRVEIPPPALAARFRREVSG
jgi:thiamine pyrophosphate-dependent acetolactate synthase large subunit-like protein